MFTFHIDGQTFHSSATDQDLILEVAEVIDRVWPEVLSHSDAILFAQEMVWEESDTGFNPHRSLVDLETFRVF